MGDIATQPTVLKENRLRCRFAHTSIYKENGQLYYILTITNQLSVTKMEQLLVSTLCVTAVKLRGKRFEVPPGTADNSPAMNDTVGKFYRFRADSSDAEERESGKAWGF